MSSIEESNVQRFEVIIPDPDAELGDEGWVDRLWAVREPVREMHPNYSWGGYWLVCGDNTGSQSLVVHDYMIQPLIKLLNALPNASKAGDV